VLAKWETLFSILVPIKTVAFKVGKIVDGQIALLLGSIV
jgi:hypothetical protein